MAHAPKIFMIGWEYPPHNSGGLGVACEGLTEAMAARDHQVYFTLPYSLQQQPDHMHMVTCRDPRWTQAADKPPFSAYTFDVSTIAGTKTKRVMAADLATLPTSEIELKVSEYADLVASAAEQHQADIDVIHAHDWMSFPAAIKVKQVTQKPLVTHIHSTEYDRIPSGAGSPYITHIEKMGMEASDLIVAVSKYTKQVLIQKYGIPARKIKVVHNGMKFSDQIRAGNHHFAQDRQTVVFMGRLTGQKGPSQFVSLAQRVLQDVPEALFIVAGHGDMYHQLLLQTAAEGMSAKVLFTGFVRDAQRTALLDRADVFLMPSLSEPFGLVALEAAERQTPVIVSKHAGVSEVLPSAPRIDFWDLDKMTAEIVRILRDRKYRTELVAKHEQEVRRVTWSRAAQKLEKLYLGLR